VDVLVLDVEEFSDLFWGFTLDHVGNGLASDVAIGQLLLEVWCQRAYRRGLMSR
jgi:hypothetical protein